MMIPERSAFCWKFLGTLNEVMMMMNTKRLSSDRAFSVRKPA